MVNKILNNFWNYLKGDKVLREIKPIDYNFYNLDREERYDFCFK